MTDQADLAAPRTYWCFLSYRHLDNKVAGRKWATWLHQSLEAYEVPPDLVGRRNDRGDLIPAAIFPVFRDEEELPADAELSRPIARALANSRFLVVLCSPNAAASRFVEKEIREYKKLGQDRKDRVLAAIIAGNPCGPEESSATPEIPFEMRQCFPRALRFEVGAEGEATDVLTEPIAADFRLPDGTEGFTTTADFLRHLRSTRPWEGKPVIERQGREFAERMELMKLKIVAGILGVPVGILTARDKAFHLSRARARAVRMRILAVVMSVLMILAVVAAFIAFDKETEAQSQRAVAEGEKIRANEQRDLALLRENEKQQLLLKASDAELKAAKEWLGKAETRFTSVGALKHYKSYTAETARILKVFPDYAGSAAVHLLNSLRFHPGNTETRRLLTRVFTHPCYYPAFLEKSVKLNISVLIDRLGRSDGDVRLEAATSGDGKALTLMLANGKVTADIDLITGAFQLRELPKEARSIVYEDRRLCIRFPDLPQFGYTGETPLWKVGQKFEGLAKAPDLKVAESAIITPGWDRLVAIEGGHFRLGGATVLAWSLPVGEQVARIQLQDGINCRAQSPSGALLAFGEGIYERYADTTAPKALHLLDLYSGRDVLLADDFPENVERVVFSPDGMTLAAQSALGTIHVYRMPPCENPLRMAEFHVPETLGMAVSDDGIVHAITTSGEVQTWRCPPLSATATPVSPFSEEDGDDATVAPFEDATATQEARLEDGSSNRRYTRSGSFLQVTVDSHSPGSESVMGIQDPSSNRSWRYELTGYVGRVIIAPDNRRLVTYTQDTNQGDGSVLVLSLQQADVTVLEEWRSKGSINALDINDTGSNVAFADLDGLHVMQTGKVRRSRQYPELGRISALRFLPGDRLAVGFQSGAVLVVEVRTLSPVEPLRWFFVDVQLLALGEGQQVLYAAAGGLWWRCDTPSDDSARQAGIHWDRLSQSDPAMSSAKTLKFLWDELRPQRRFPKSPTPEESAETVEWLALQAIAPTAKPPARITLANALERRSGVENTSAESVHWHAAHLRALDVQAIPSADPAITFECARMMLSAPEGARAGLGQNAPDFEKAALTLFRRCLEIDPNYEDAKRFLRVLREE